MSMQVGLLADHPEVLSSLATAFERESPEWYGVHGDAMTDLRERSRRTGLPVGFVAIDGATAVGTLAIAERSLRSHRHLSPWIIGFWVEPSQRNRGIGAQLLGAACAHATMQRIACLYAATASASNLFKREGWASIDTGTTDLGERVDVFSKTLAS